MRNATPRGAEENQESRPQPCHGGAQAGDRQAALKSRRGANSWREGEGMPARRFRRRKMASESGDAIKTAKVTIELRAWKGRETFRWRQISGGAGRDKLSPVTRAFCEQNGAQRGGETHSQAQPARKQSPPDRVMAPSQRTW